MMVFVSHYSDLNVVTVILAKFSFDNLFLHLHEMPSVLVLQIGCFSPFGIPYVLTF